MKAKIYRSIAVIQVDMGYACYGLLIRSGMVIDTAPIMRWAAGKPWANIRPWIERRGSWTIVSENKG